MTDATLKHLASLSKSLNEASDVLSKQIAQAEAALNELKLGIWAWVVIGRYDEEWKVGSQPQPVTRTERIGYGKHKGKWGLLFSADYDEFPDPQFAEMCFLRDAPRMEKLEAVEKLPDLIKALEAKAVEVTEDATKKAAQVNELAAALSKITH